MLIWRAAGNCIWHSREVACFTRWSSKKPDRLCSCFHRASTRGTGQSSEQYCSTQGALIAKVCSNAKK
ncbi:hypothetical protein V5799_004974 [Amblyomma americanum]|uniref:Uncharacterized protein n=1 Tax=Amblyomma americanum TaxID=6943 RepID=A0AAQ4D4K8_AMBAM